MATVNLHSCLRGIARSVAIQCPVSLQNYAANWCKSNNYDDDDAVSLIVKTGGRIVCVGPYVILRFWFALIANVNNCKLAKTSSYS